MITCKHRVDGIGQLIYVEGYLLIPSVNLAAEDCLVQSLPILLLDFRFTLTNLVEILVNFAQRRAGCICTEEILYGLRPGSDASVT